MTDTAGSELSAAGSRLPQVRVTRESTLRLFSTIVETLDLELPDGDRERLVSFLMSERASDGAEASSDWISRADLHTEHVFRPIVTAAEELATRSQRRCGLEVEGMGVVSMWGFAQRGTVLRDSHSHHNAYLSGVFYLEAPAGSGVLSLVDPLQHLKVIQPSRRADLTPERPEYWDHLSALEIQPNAGLMLIFPAWLSHAIGPSRPDVSLRLSVAFNLMPQGPIGGRTGRFTYLPGPPA